MTVTQANSLSKDTVTFFLSAAVTNDEIFAFMTEVSSWPDPTTAGKTGTGLKTITKPVILLLCTLAKDAHKILSEG